MLKNYILKFNLFILYLKKKFIIIINFIIIYKKIFNRLNFINKIYKLIIYIKNI